MSDILKVGQFDAEVVVDSIMQNGAASVPLIMDKERQSLLEQAIKERIDEFKGGGFRKVGYTPLDNLTGSFLKLKEDLEKLINGPISESARHPLESELHFTSYTLNYYPLLSSLSKHHDGWHSGLICIAVLGGRAGFYVSPVFDYDRFEETRVRMPSAPGSIIFMRGIGFMGETNPVFHQVTRVTAPRYSLVFR